MSDQIKYRAWTFFRDGRPVYATDKPGCDGRKKSATYPNSDWGYGSEKDALAMSEYECKQFAKYQNQVNRQGFFSPI